MKPFWEGLTPKLIFPRTFFFKLRFCKLWWESLIKPKKEIHGAGQKHDCNPVVARVDTFPCSRPRWPVTMQTAFARALTGGDSTALLQHHPWKNLYSSVLANSSFTTVFTEAALAWLLPSVWEGCLTEGEEHGAGRQYRPRSRPSYTKWLIAWPWETLINFCIWFHYFAHRNAGEIS